MAASNPTGLTGDNQIYVEHAFGPGLRNFPDLPVHGTADEVRRYDQCARSRRFVTGALLSSTASTS
jgi:hypothetical protein